MIKKKIDQKILRSLLFIDADSAWLLLFIRLCLIDLALKKVKFSCLFVFFVFYFVKSDQRSFHYFRFQISSFTVITQKGESKNECFKKTKNAKFSEKRTFLTTWYAHVRTGQKCSFFEKFGMTCFLETLVLTFALLPYYRRAVIYLTFKDSCVSRNFTIS